MTKKERLAAEIDRTDKMHAFDIPFLEEYELVCGVDEVGRGPLAGPVVTAAVILPRDCHILYINDSKKLSPKKREETAAIIMEQAVSFAFGEVDEKTIDKINILNATKMAMRMAINSLDKKADLALIDALDLDGLDIPVKAFVKGDAQSMSIAAASIIAKVRRDHFMVSMDEKYPEYGFARNKGYGTKEHMDALKKYGPCPIHRRTFLKFLSE
jgi:ribonuclease HII